MLSDAFALNQASIGQLKMRDWALIEEALQDGLSAGPEKEFFVNAVQHSRVDNLRLAVVESVKNDPPRT